MLAWFSDRPLDFTPGERFSYSNSGYAVLTKLIETVSNIPYADYLQTNILEPLAMTHTGYDSHEQVEFKTLFVRRHHKDGGVLNPIGLFNN